MAIGTRGLTDLVLNKQVKIIKQSTFSHCEDLKRAILNNGLIAIGEDTFASCINLETLELPSSLETIAGLAFYETAIKKLTIPSNVKYIGDCALNIGKSLKELTFEGIPIKIGNDQIDTFRWDGVNPHLVINVPWTRAYEKEQIANKQWNKNWLKNRSAYKINYRK